MKPDIPVFKKTEFIVSAVIALLILAWNLKNSFEFGRLAFVPLYDDVAYFNDAVVRYQKFVNGNVFSLVKDAFSNPPHSPLMAFQAVFSYILLGVEDWAPYLTLVWIPFLVVLLALSYTRDIGPGRWILILYVITTPLLDASVVEFRPDIGNGIVNDQGKEKKVEEHVESVQPKILSDQRLVFSPGENHFNHPNYQRQAQEPIEVVMPGWIDDFGL